MAELLNGLKRTDMCGNLRKNDENREVVVMGFVAKTRDLGNLVFIDLRDRTGIVQLAFDAGVDAALTDKARSVRAEYVVSAKGTVRLRTGKNINCTMPDRGTIGERVKIVNTKEIINSVIGPDCEISGASRLSDCTLQSVGQPVYIGRNRISNCVITSLSTSTDAKNANGAKFTMQLQVVNLASSDYVEMGEQLMSAQDAGASTSASSTNQTKATGAEGLKSTVGETISSSAYSAYVKSYQNKPASSSGPNARNAAAFSAA